MNGLLTDFYELTMAAGYFMAGKASDLATFEFSIRRMPRNRDFVLMAGLHRAVEYLLNLSFEHAEIEYLCKLPQFSRTPAEFWDYLADFRFTGDVFAVPEGTIICAGQPVMTIRAPLIEAQIPETFLLSAVAFETLVATKAARVVHEANGRDVIEFGTRRAQTPEAGVLAARAAYIGGCSGTSNTLAGFRYGIPVMGTAAHSWVMSFESEATAFAELQRLLGEQTIQLIDTYDTVEGARLTADLGKPLWGVRIDSGDLFPLSHEVRRILDAAGLQNAKIMASGDLDEARVGTLMEAGAPIDAFGVGTEIATSADAPFMGTIYKLVQIEHAGKTRYTAKSSPEKSTLPGAKQLFRFPDYDMLGVEDESADGSEPLLKPVVKSGQVIEPLPSVQQIRERALANLARREKWPPGPRRTEISPALQQRTAEFRAAHVMA